MKKYQQVTFPEAMDDLMKIFKACFNVKKKPGIDHYDYNGKVEIEHVSVIACAPNIKEAFTKDFVEYEKERGRSMFDIFLACIYRLGYSSGRIDSKEDESFNMTDRLLNMLKTDTNVLKVVECVKALREIEKIGDEKSIQVAQNALKTIQEIGK